jgi:excisionase family DNA binding protein
MTNPFESIESRLSNIETLLIDLKFPSKPADDITKEKLLTVQETAELMRLQPSTIYKLVHNRKIRHMKQGKRLYFDRNELLNWIASGNRQTIDEIRSEAEETLCSSGEK